MFPFSAQVSKAGLRIGSVTLALREDKVATYRAQRESVEAIERCVDGVIADILNVLETSIADDSEFRLVMKFQEFDHYFTQLTRLDPEAANMCISNYKARIQGPPNCPMKKNG